MGAAQGQIEPMLGLLAQGTSTTVKLFLLLTVLSFASAALICLTSFTRIIIVLSFLRQALGTPQLPPNQVLIGLSLFLTMFVMGPTLTELNDRALSPFLDDKITHTQAANEAGEVIRAFLLSHTREEDLRVFYEVSNTPRPSRHDEIPLKIAAPAFMISELTTAFQMGLYIFIPLLLVDLLVSSVLMALGMMMVPPMVVSLPLKIAVFLMADGWRLIITALAQSFG
ncbi:MAG: flagellar type III secretion system pore protein FliP [Myxococcota bacterium]